MGLELARMWVSVRGDVRELAGDLQGASGPVGMLVDSLKFRITGAISAVGAVGTEFIRMGIRAAEAHEQTVIGFETMMGSAEAAADLLQRLTKFAEITPYEMPEILAAARGLVQFGETGDRLMETLQVLGNAASGANTDFSFLALIFNQVRGVGKLLTQDFRQLSTRGVISLQDIATHYKVTTQAAEGMISSGKVGFEDLRKIFVNLSADGGRFHNLMERQSKTLGGLHSTLSDAYSISARLIATPLVEAMKPLYELMLHVLETAGPLIDGISKGAGPIVDVWKKAVSLIKDAWDAVDVKELGARIKKWMEDVGKDADGFINAFVFNWNAAWDKLKEATQSGLDILWHDTTALFKNVWDEAGTYWLRQFEDVMLEIRFMWADTVAEMKTLWDKAMNASEEAGSNMFEGLFDFALQSAAVFEVAVERQRRLRGHQTPDEQKAEAEKIQKEALDRLNTRRLSVGLALGDIFGSDASREADRKKNQANIEAQREKDRVAALKERLHMERIIADAERHRKEQPDEERKDLVDKFKRNLAELKKIGEDSAPLPPLFGMVPYQEGMFDKMDMPKGGIPGHLQRHGLLDDEGFLRMGGGGAAAPGIGGFGGIDIDPNVAQFREMQAKAEKRKAERREKAEQYHEEMMFKRLPRNERARVLAEREIAESRKNFPAKEGSIFGKDFDSGGSIMNVREYGRMLQSSVLKSTSAAMDPAAATAKNTGDMLKVAEEQKVLQQKLLDKPNTLGLT